VWHVVVVLIIVADVYQLCTVDCQWIDITDVPDGLYDLEIELNAADPVTGERKVQELRYDNNVYRVAVTITGSGASGGSTQCQVGEWSEWGPCTLQCGVGTQMRSRTATGFNCPATSEERYCNTHPCGDEHIISEDGRCGNASPVQARCPAGQCCSRYGWCGSSDAHCNDAQAPPEEGDDSSPGDSSGGDGGDGDGDGNSGDGDGNSGDGDGNSGDGDGNTGGPGSLCQGCWPGTSGYCKGANGVCYGYFPGTTTCPGGTNVCGVHEEDIDCAVDPWTAWSTCSNACGGGQQERRRIVTMPQHGNGAACPSPLQEFRSCNVDPCDDDDDADGNTDCAVSPWSAWGLCDVECGGGSAVRRREVIIAPTGDGASCPVLEESRECNPEACDMGPTSCDNCFPGTSGPCQSYNSVCFAAFNYNGIESCPAGTSRCASVGSLSADPAVNFEVTIGGVDAMDYMEAATQVRKTLARKLQVLPDAIKVKGVAGAIVVEGDQHHDSRRLHGGGELKPGMHTTTLSVEIVVPQRYGAAAAAGDVATNVQKLIGDDIMSTALREDGLGAQFTQLDPSNVQVMDAGSEPTVTLGGSQSADSTGSSSGLAAVLTPAMAIAVGCSALVGALVAVGVMSMMQRRQRNNIMNVPKPRSTRSFNRIAIQPAGTGRSQRGGHD